MLAPPPKESQSPTDSQLLKIKKLIDSKQITAITIDTTTFDQSGRRYDSGIFSQLRQFKNHPQKLIISDVVTEEINTHYRERVTKSYARLDGIGKVCEFLGGSLSSISIINAELDRLQSLDEICTFRLQEFLSDSNAMVLCADDYIKVSHITSMYFQNLPPFHMDNKKKGEFPDAIALATLERWAEQNNTCVVVVSNDGDWKAFCDKSQRLYLVKTLPSALSVFQSPTEIVEEMLLKLNRELRDHGSKTSSLLHDSIAGHNWQENITPVLDANYDCDEAIEFQLISAGLMDCGPNAVKITNNDGKMVSFAFDCEVTGIATVHCHFKRWNDADSEYEFIGYGSSANRLFTVTSVLLTMPVSQGDFFDIAIQLQPSNVRVEFPITGPV